MGQTSDNSAVARLDGVLSDSSDKVLFLSEAAEERGENSSSSTDCNSCSKEPVEIFSNENKISRGHIMLRRFGASWAGDLSKAPAADPVARQRRSSLVTLNRSKAKSGSSHSEGTVGDTTEPSLSCTPVNLSGSKTVSTFFMDDSNCSGAAGMDHLDLQWPLTSAAVCKSSLKNMVCNADLNCILPENSAIAIQKKPGKEMDYNKQRPAIKQGREMRKRLTNDKESAGAISITTEMLPLTNTTSNNLPRSTHNVSQLSDSISLGSRRQLLGEEYQLSARRPSEVLNLLAPATLPLLHLEMKNETEFSMQSSDDPNGELPIQRMSPLKFTPKLPRKLSSSSDTVKTALESESEYLKKKDSQRSRRQRKSVKESYIGPSTAESFVPLCQPPALNQAVTKLKSRRCTRHISKQPMNRNDEMAPGLNLANDSKPGHDNVLDSVDTNRERLGKWWLESFGEDAME